MIVSWYIMMNHEKSSRFDLASKQPDTTTATSNKYVSFERELKEIGLDDVVRNTQDPLFLGMLVFKLLEERKKMNDLLDNLNKKYDDLMFKLKNEDKPLTESEAVHEYAILSEQDQEILNVVKQKTKVEATDIMLAMNYKKQNGAAQRLNKLVKEGWLKKLRAGRKVFFIEK